MLVVLSCFSGDIQMSIRLMEWIAKLNGGPHQSSILLIVDSEIDWFDFKRLRNAASLAFSDPFYRESRIAAKGWSDAPNQVFHLACSEAFKMTEPWLWLESDCVPLRKGWLEAIEAEYAQLGKPYMGDIYVSDKHPPGTQPQFMSGIAVYPATAFQELKFAGKLAWDMENAHHMIANGAHTDLVRHRWGEKDLPPTFVERIETNAAVNAFTPEMIRPQAVLFHRNKDGTLIDLLDKKLFPPPEPSSNGHADVVSLRRNGDIICLLPAMKAMSLLRGRKVRLVVHQDFVPLLDGVSYVEPVVWRGGWEEPLLAAAKHKAVNAQVFGKGLAPDTIKENFAMLAWKKLGFHWNRHQPLLFDQRDYEREKRLADSTFKTDKPKILVKLHGFSSPFPHGKMIHDMIAATYGQSAEIVNLDNVTAHRIYDLIGLMDRAACLVTVDTSAHWLAHASRIPLISFVNGWGFAASPPRGNQIMRVPYQEATQHITTMLRLIGNCLMPASNDSITLVHSAYIPGDPDTKRRNDVAMKTWPLLGAKVLPFQNPPNRTSANVGDARRVPFVKDMIDTAFHGHDGIVVITNNDIKFDPELAQDIRESCRDWGCWWAYRTEQKDGQTDNGADVFAMTRKWWAIHNHLMPDMLLGYHWWDDVLLRLMIWSGCHEQRRLYYHEPHPASASPTRTTTPGHRHNETLAMQWLKQHWERRQKPYE